MVGAFSGVLGAKHTRLQNFWQSLDSNPRAAMPLEEFEAIIHSELVL